MLSLSNLSLRRGPKVLFANVSMTIHQGQRVGLVGANGAGKTSLFRLITGELEADQGDLGLPTSTRVAHLKQEVLSTNQQAIEYVLDGDPVLRKIETAIAAANESGNYGEIGNLHEALDSIDGYAARTRAEQLLAGLGFTPTQFTEPLSAFSGGWRIRLNLAQTLMMPSDLLLLDEPTNHLDLDAIVWLSAWIKAYQGTLLLISHDREFLDETVNHIAYLQSQTIELFSGNYSQFERIKAARLAEQQSNFEKQQREILHMQDFVRRFRAKATKARQAQSRIKALDRLELIAPAHIDSPFNFEIPATDKISDPLLTLADAVLGYESPILQELSVSLHPGNRIGLLGHNGAGKSTLVKSLVGELALLAGERVQGANLCVGYFSQHQIDDLDLEASPLLQLRRLDEKLSEQEIRNYLGGYDFRGDRVFEPVKIFSGGEKARLALALVAYQKPNLLLMDEPTNHLDIDMRHALTVALQTFEGALLLISHDRHLLTNTVDSFWLIEDGRVGPFEGDLEDYRLRVMGKQTAANKADNAKKSAERIASAVQQKSRGSGKDVRQLRTRVKTLDDSITRLHRKLTEVEASLADVSLYESQQSDELQTLLREQLNLQSALESAEEEWLEKSEQLETLTNS